MPQIETHLFTGDDSVPNNPALPLVVYRGALAGDGDRAAACEAMFNRNRWPHPWRNGIYGHHHYHATAHEVLGIAAGWARVRLGGENGKSVELSCSARPGAAARTAAAVAAVPLPAADPVTGKAAPLLRCWRAKR